MIDKPPFAIQAAKVSWMAPLLALALGFFTKSATSNSQTLDPEMRQVIWLIVGAICVLMAVAGLILGLRALLGIKKHGIKGIPLPSIVGILLSSGYLYLIVNSILYVRRLIEEGSLPVQS